MKIKKENFVKSHNFWTAIISEALSPLLKSIALNFVRTKSSPRENWNSILVLGNDHIGDVLYHTASLGLLKEKWPNSQILFATSETGALILKNNPNIDKILVYKSKTRFFVELVLMRLAKKSIKFDAVLCTNPVKYWPSLLFAVFMGIPNRVAYTFKGFSGLVSHPVHFSRYEPLPLLLRKFYEDVCHCKSSTLSLKPVIFPSTADRRKAEHLFGIINSSDKLTIALFITDRQGNCHWPLNLYKELIVRIQSEFDALFILIGSPSEKAQLKIFHQELSDVTQLLNDDLSPLELACFLQQCALVITKDSGPRHLANSVGTPVVFFRSLAHREAEAGIYCENEVDLCPPAELIPSKKQINILRRIPVRTVMNAVRNSLKNQR
jgi:heptosyltransferase-2